MVDSIIRVTCPHCHTLIPPPFVRGVTPQTNTHASRHDPHGRRCRVIIVTSLTDDNHRVTRVRDGETFEDALAETLRKLAA